MRSRLSPAFFLLDAHQSCRGFLRAHASWSAIIPRAPRAHSVKKTRITAPSMPGLVLSMPPPLAMLPDGTVKARIAFSPEGSLACKAGFGRRRSARRLSLAEASRHDAAASPIYGQRPRMRSTQEAPLRRQRYADGAKLSRFRAQDIHFSRRFQTSFTASRLPQDFRRSPQDSEDVGFHDWCRYCEISGAFQK